LAEYFIAIAGSTSSASNVGSDTDSEQRQRAAITGYAKAAGMSSSIGIMTGREGLRPGDQPVRLHGHAQTHRRQGVARHPGRERIVRQVLGAVAQFEKARPVAKFKAARDGKTAAAIECGGRG
jgi:hypothetical protein